MRDIFENHRLFILVLLAYAIVLFSGIARTPIFILDEAKNASCAFEMLQGQEAIVPTFNEVLRTDKPPLHYYFMATGYVLFGKTPFGARFFSVFFGLLTLFIVYYYVGRNIDKKTAMASVLVLAASTHFSLEFHLAVPDPYLIFFMTLSLFCFYDYFEHRRIREWALMILGLSLGTLSKGPIALGLPGLIGLIFMLMNRSTFFEKLRALRPLRAVLLYCLIVLPWFIAVHIQTDGQWTQGFFLDHNVGRFTKEMEGHGSFFLLPALISIVGLLPFSGYLPALIKNHPWKNSNGLIRFAVLAFLIIILFFSISSTLLPNYVMPAYPMLAVLLGFVLARWNLHLSKGFLIFNGILLLALMVLIIYANEIDPIFHWQKSQLLVLFVPFCLALWPLIRKVKAIHFVVGAWMSFAVLLFGTFLPTLAKQDPVQEAFRLFDLKAEECVYFERFSPAFTFYLDAPLESVRGKDDFEERIKDPHLKYVISTKRYHDFLSKNEDLRLVFSKKDLFESRVTEIWALKRH